MDHDDDLGSPSKLSRRQRAIHCHDKSSTRTSKRRFKVSTGLFILSVYVGVYFQDSNKLVHNFLELPIGDRYAVDQMREDLVAPTMTGGKNMTTLALLYPPGMMGGYRNQVLRFIAFVVHAKENNITQMLLPSVLWTTKMIDLGYNRSEASDGQAAATVTQRDFPIPFEWVFDVDHWNTYHESLPLLVTPDDQVLSSSILDCWIQSSEMSDVHALHDATQYVDTSVPNRPNMFYYRYDRSNFNTTDSSSSNVVFVNHLQRAVLLQGMIRPIATDVIIPILTNQRTINPRKFNVAPDTEHCINPRVHGGGKQAGVLWNAYISYLKSATTAVVSTSLTNESGGTAASNSIAITNKSFVPFDTDIWIYQALQPAKMWRRVAQECVQTHAPSGKYIALHARVELEMMEHVCGSGMEKNLSRIVDQVYQLYDEQPESVKASISAFFIAVSRDGMEVTSNYRNNKFRPFAMDNWQTLNRITQGSSNESSNVLPAFECGEKILQEFYRKNPSIPNHGTLLQSVINFYIAVSSEIFVGVSQSSYSTDILTTRYWLGKGASNYRYTMDGIEQVENGGLPVPHSNCQRHRPSPKQKYTPIKYQH